MHAKEGRAARAPCELHVKAVTQQHYGCSTGDVLASVCCAVVPFYRESTTACTFQTLVSCTNGHAFCVRARARTGATWLFSSPPLIVRAVISRNGHDRFQHFFFFFFPQRHKSSLAGFVRVRLTWSVPFSHAFAAVRIHHGAYTSGEGSNRH